MVELKIPEFLKFRPSSFSRTTRNNMLQDDSISSESGNLFQYMNGLNGLFSTKFAKDIFENKALKTHDEKRLCKKYYRENSLIYSSIRTKRDLLLGDGRKIITENMTLKTFLQESFLETSNWTFAEEIAIEEAIVTGDGYIERLQGDKTIRYQPIFNSEDIYIDYDYEKQEVKRYIQRIYTKNNSVGKDVKQFTIWTPYGIESIYGYDLGRDNIIHFKRGNDIYGVYGRSDIAPTLNDLRILDVIERSVAVISKYKAIPKFSLSAEDSEESPLDEDEMTEIRRALQDATDYENAITSRKLSRTDLSYAGKDINLQPYIDYLKRKITISMAPEFLIHGQEVNRATSKEQKQTWFLRISSERYPFEIIATSELTYAVNFLSSYLNLGPVLKFKYEYGDFDIELPEERHQRIVSDFQSGIMTLQEARNEKEYREIPGTDLFSWELPSTGGDNGGPQ